MRFVFMLLVPVLLQQQGLFAQNHCESGRYAFPVFNCVDTTLNVPYGQGRRNWSSTNIFCQHGNLPPYNAFQTLLADVYEPCNDSEQARPLLIAIHGGAWAAGDKADLAPFCTQMAQRGYVVASISYRLSLTANILCWNAEVDEIRLTRAFYRAMQDAKAAVRYFRANATQYRIDPDKIFVAGHSAGAFTALGVGYLTDPAERPAATYHQSYCGSWFNQPVCTDLGDIEGEGGNPGISSAVRGVASLAGALPAMSYLSGPNEPPLLLVHGTADDVVPFGAACVLPNLGPLFNTCILTYGSAAIYPYADSIGMDVELLSFPGGGHGFTNAELDSIYIRLSRFMCCRMNGGGCQTISSLEEHTGASPFEAYPNPCSGRLMLRTRQAGPLNMALLDATGRILQRHIILPGESELDLSLHPAGLYFLHSLQSGGRPHTMRIVKQ